MRPSSYRTALAALLLAACSLDETSGTFPDDESPDLLDGAVREAGIRPNDASSPVDGGPNQQQPDGAVQSCSGAMAGSTEQRIRYAAAQVLKASQCISETQSRSCANGSWTAWTGSYQAESCVEAQHASCGPVLHGNNDTRRRYAAALVNDVAKCKPEDQLSLCSDGVLGPWTGVNTALECKIDFRGPCDLLTPQLQCVTGSTCVFSTAKIDTLCLGTSGHECSSNSDCASSICVLGKCVAKQSEPGGSCDEASDCTGCKNRFGVPLLGGTCVQSTCRCPDTANCTSDRNDWCAGTCVANQCAPANGVCDAVNGNADCRGENVCNVTPANAHRCSLPAGTGCDNNGQCAAACRPAVNAATPSTCQPLGANGDACHGTENADCAAPLVCRGSSICQPVGSLSAQCEENSDCGTFMAGPVSIKLACGASVNQPLLKLCLIAAGGPCTTDYDCASGDCLEPSDAGTTVCK